MNIFDYQIISFFNQFVRQSWTFDNVVNFISDSHLFRGYVLVPVFWWAWFEDEKKFLRNRKIIISTILCSVVAMALGRALALLLPFRLRPIHNEALGFITAHETSPHSLSGWSSFPSDHAVLFLALTTGIYLLSKRIGLFALLYSIVFMFFPRIYLGLHYPTDILAGGLIGWAIVFFGHRFLVESKCVRVVVSSASSHPKIFYPLFFIVTCEIANMFGNTRSFLKWGVDLIQAFIG